MTDAEKILRDKHALMRKLYKRNHTDDDFDFSVFVAYTMWMQEAKFWKLTAVVSLLVAALAVLLVATK